MRTCVWGCACGGACSTVDMGGGTICRASRDVVRATGWCAHALRWQSGGSSTDVRAAAHTALRVPRVCMSTRGWSTLVARAPGFQVHHRFPRSSTSSTRAFFCGAKSFIKYAKITIFVQLVRFLNTDLPGCWVSPIPQDGLPIPETSLSIP